MRITDATLVAAATAIYMRHNGTGWDNETSEVKGMFLRDAQAALEAAAPFLAGAAGLDPECGCALKGCVHQPALSEEGRRKMVAGQPTAQQQNLANVIVGMTHSLATINAQVMQPLANAFQNDMANMATALRSAERDYRA